MIKQTKQYQGFELVIEVNKFYRKIEILTTPGDWRSSAVTIRQAIGGDNKTLSESPVINWSAWGDQPIETARRFAQAIELAALIAADFESWINE